MAGTFLDDKFNEYINKIRFNSDDFVWFLFEKPCGYSFLHVFPRNASVQSLYEYLDCLWSDSMNQIWDSNYSYLHRNQSTKLRTWILENNIKPYSLGFPLVYKIYFDTISKPKLFINLCKCSSTLNNNFNDNNTTNNNSISNNSISNISINNSCTNNDEKTID